MEQENIRTNHNKPDFDNAIVRAIEELDDKRQKKFSSSIKTIYTFFLIGVTLVGSLMTYINTTTLSMRDFSGYREAQTEAISFAIRDAIIPITSRLAESNDNIATLSSEIVKLQLKFIELNGRITGNNFVETEKFTQEISKLNATIQDLRVRLVASENNKEAIISLQSDLKKLTQQLNEIERRVSLLH